MTTKTNEQRKAITLIRVGIINKKTSGGKVCPYDELWAALQYAKAVDEITKDNFRGKLFNYGVKIKAGCVSRKDAPKPVTYSSNDNAYVVVDKFAPDPWWYFIYKILAKLRGTFQ